MYTPCTLQTILHTSRAIHVKRIHGQPKARLVITLAYVAVPPRVPRLQFLDEEPVQGAQAEVLQHLAW